MAEVQVARLVASFEANSRKFDQSIRKIEADSRRTAALLKQHLGAGGRLTEGLDTSFAKSARAAEASLAKVSGSALAAEASIVALRRGFGLLAAAVSVQQVGQLADQYKSLQNVLKISGLEGTELTTVYRALMESAQRNGVPVQDLAKLYGRVSSAQKELKASSGDLLKLTDAVGLALKVSGQDASEASGALLQLGQALAGGKIQAEEFNSLLDGARPLLQAAAAGLKEAGGSVGELTKLVKDGKVSSEAFFRAILAGVPVLEQAAKSADPTLSQAWVKLKNRMVDAVGAADSATGATKALAQVMEGLGRAIDKLSGKSWIDNIEGYKDSIRAVEITKELLELEKQRAAAGALAGQTKLRGDYAMVQVLQARIDSLNAEFNSIKERGLKANLEPPAKPPEKTPVTIPPEKQVSLKDFPITDGGGAKKMDDDIAALHRRTEALRLETEMVGKSVYETERARAAHELLAQAKAAEIPITDELRAKINAAADAYASQASKADEAKKAHERIADAQREMASAASEFAKGFIRDMRDGKSATEAFGNALDRLAQRMLDRMLDDLFMALLGPSKSGGGGSGGLMSMITSLFAGHADGGLITGPGTGTSDSIPARLSAGEFVVRAEATRRTLPLLHAINESGGRIPRFASGGLVEPRLFSPALLRVGETCLTAQRPRRYTIEVIR